MPFIKCQLMRVKTLSMWASSSGQKTTQCETRWTRTFFILGRHPLEYFQAKCLSKLNQLCSRCFQRRLRMYRSVTFSSLTLWFRKCALNKCIWSNNKKIFQHHAFDMRSTTEFIYLIIECIDCTVCEPFYERSSL